MASFNTGGAAHQLVTGFEMSRMRDTYTQRAQLLQPLDLTNPFEADLGIYPIPLPQANQAGDSRSLVIAPYLIDRITLSGSFELLAGARWDNIDFEDTVTGTERDASRLSPLGGLVFKPVPDVSIYASAGMGFAPPSIQVVGPRDPEESTQLEGGVKLSFLAGKGYAGAAVYQLERENIAVPDSTGLSRQSGSQRSRGFELELSAEPRAGLSARVHYAYTSAELTSYAELLQTEQGIFVLDRTGNVPAFAPRHIASFWGTVPLGHGFSLGAGLRYVSEQFVAADNRNRHRRLRALRRRGLLRAGPGARRRAPAQPREHGVRHARLRLRLGDPGAALRGHGPRRARLRPPLRRSGRAELRAGYSTGSS